tara:strand:+ start:5866 stop:6561 length:696 start_codon:yes stop_codon:yes gene_type:complete
MKLLTTNTKLLKDPKNFLALGLQLAPYNLSGVANVCPNASAGCAAACLFSAGRGRFNNVIQARVNRTKFFFADKKGFFAQLYKETKAAQRKATKEGKRLALRLNTISDIAWEKIKIDGKNVFDTFPDIQFWDYTKSPQRMTAFLNGELPDNYHLTFSRSEENESLVKAVVASNGNVAAVFRGELPKTYMGKPVISGDNSDLRFLDPKGCIVGLVEKGLAKKDTTGFVLEPN